MIISIIIPIYNVAQYIERCLYSIFNQSYTKGIECVLVDDCGADDSMMKVERLLKEYSGPISFNIVRHQQNQGLSCSRNTGILKSTGDYIYFLDSDDAITPNCLETFVDIVNKYIDVDVVQGDMAKGEKGLADHYFRYPLPEYVTEKEQVEKVLFTEINNTATNRLLKRSFIMEHSLFFPVGIVHEDVFWSYFVAKNARCVAFINRGTYFYYNNENSIMHTCTKHMIIKRLYGYRFSVETFWEDIISNGSCRYQRQYLADTLIRYIESLSNQKYISQWFLFWRMLIKQSARSLTKVTKWRFLFFLLILPPFCFFINRKGLQWRIRYFICPKL